MANELDQYTAAYDATFAYEFDNNIMLNWYPERIMQAARPDQALLELGIGHGYSTQRFSEFFARHDVIDGSPAVIERFRATFPDCKAVIHEAYFEDFIPETKYDLIVMGFVLEHVEDPSLILRHFRQFLKPGGKCFVAVPNGETLHRRFGRAANLLSDYFALTDADLALGHRRVYSVDTLRAEIEAAGYVLEKTEGIFLKPLTTSQLLSLKLDEKITRAMCEVGVDYPELCAGLLIEASAP
jgi:2-polyprenyl-3-methyl-5-hydroxy-6-metoxy-1,4-benzoquinol methylase